MRCGTTGIVSSGAGGYKHEKRSIRGNTLYGWIEH